jgi:hypothetical protein
LVALVAVAVEDADPVVDHVAPVLELLKVVAMDRELAAVPN